jgi:hypothetical protein
MGLLNSIDVVDVDPIEFYKESNRKRFRDAKINDAVLRTVVVSLPQKDSTTWKKLVANGLEGFLADADSHMAQVAATIGATVVEHTWLLLPQSPGMVYPDVIHTAFGVSRTFRLGAQVRVLNERKAFSVEYLNREDYFATQQQLQQTGLDHLREFGWWIPDVTAPHQYTRHSNEVILHDIEPRVTDFT